MKNKKIKIVHILFVGFIVTFFSSLIFLYLLIDRSISYTYLSVSYDGSKLNTKQITKLLAHEWQDLDENELLEKLKNYRKLTDSKILIKNNKEKNIISFDQVKFKFENGKLTYINRVDLQKL